MASTATETNPQPPSPTKIAIVGKAPSSRGLAPYHDDEWEIWTLADLVMAGQVPRFHRHFELHPLNWFETPDGAKYIEWMGSVTEQPIYLIEPAEAIPRGVAYPKDEMVAAFGRYFNNTVSWMLALAIAMKPQEIGIWGVDMAAASEYEQQRPSCEYFIGLARGAGINVHVPPQSDLLTSPRLYGFDYADCDAIVKWQTKCAELQERIARKSQKRDQLAYETAYLEGCHEVTQQYLKQWL